MSEARSTEAAATLDVRSPGRILEANAERLSALGHPVRLRILRRVVKAGDGGLSAGDIQGEVGLPASTLSHHLKRLVDAGLLIPRSEGTYHFYSPDFAALRALTNYVWEDCCARGSDGTCTPRLSRSP